MRQNIKTTNDIFNQVTQGALIGNQLMKMSMHKVIDKVKRNPNSGSVLIAGISQASAWLTGAMGEIQRLKKHLKQSEEVLDAIKKSHLK